MRDDSPAFHCLQLGALVFGLLGFLLAVITPILPVEQDRPVLRWPQGDAASVGAPLVSYVPLSMEVMLPSAMWFGGLAEGGTVFATVPAASEQAASKGLVVRLQDDPELGRVVAVLVRDMPLLLVPAEKLGNSATLWLRSDANRTRVEVTGANGEDKPLVGQVTGDSRPQVVGLFTDLSPEQIHSARAEVAIDARFSTRPSWMKRLAMIGALAFTLLALLASHRMDGTDRRRARRFLPTRWRRLHRADAVVLGTLLLWHFIGANTSDDGYILNMARASRASGYIANYYRWFGVAEAPFGWPYEVLAWLTRISAASLWMRLPALLAGITCWLVLSREVLPRLGARVRRGNVAMWTAGLVFLAVWLPYNNGLRPEPLIAAGVLLTWCGIEWAIVTRRFLPAAVGVLIAAFSLAAGPTGLICVAALVAGSRPVLRIVVKRAAGTGSAVLRYGALLAPGIAAGTLVLVVLFVDQTLASVMEATRVRSLVGPNVPWFDERVRWDFLLSVSPDGSVARRFGILAMLLCLGLCMLAVLRKNGHIPGTARGPSARILGILILSLFLMMFTPTKWTHHFGVYAGLAGSVAALAAVAVGVDGMCSPRNRALVTAAVCFLLAITFAGSNDWWYVSSYGVPFRDKAPQIAGSPLSTLCLGLAALSLLIALWRHHREPYLQPGPPRAFDKFAIMPLTLAAAALVLFEVLSLATAAANQYPAFSIAKSNLKLLAGSSCGLADEVLVETNTDTSLLHPWTVSDADGLSAENVEFTPNGVATDLAAQDAVTGKASPVIDNADKMPPHATGAATPGETNEPTGINGSNVVLPFGLNPATTPVLGSYAAGKQKVATLTTQWYQLYPQADMRNNPAYSVLVVTAAGHIKSVDQDGVETYGQDLFVEYGTRDVDGKVSDIGRFRPLDIGPNPSWRNLRVPLDQIPASANSVRLVAVDANMTQRQWLAVTPPRLPRLEKLNTLVGKDVPVLADWAVGLAFPCQRPFDHKDGVAEVPRWRILPDRVGADAFTAWQGDIGGGPLGWTALLLRAKTIPTYLNHDWGRDWGSLKQFTPLVDAPAAQLSVTVETRSGLAKDAPIRTR